MSKKYEILKDDTIMHGPCLTPLHRIRALRDFDDVSKGQLGGYVESERNLSHDGDCWIEENAIVYENARVLENARIGGLMEIFGEITVSGSVTLMGTDYIQGEGTLDGSILVAGTLGAGPGRDCLAV